MPQKKNPEVLEIVRARASFVLGDFTASAAAVKSLPTTYNLDFQEITPKLWASIDNVAASVDILTKLMANLKVSSNVEHKAAAGFVGATELANMLVRKYNVAFRTAHKIAGALVKSLSDSKKTLLDATPELLHKAAAEAAGISLDVKDEDLEECSDPVKLVETHRALGGPSPSVVKQSIETSRKSIMDSETNIAKLKKNLVDAEGKLNRVIESYVG